MRIAVGQIEVFPKNILENTDRILKTIEFAKENNADILILPDSAVTGKFIGEAWEENSFVEEYKTAKGKIVAAAENLMLISSNYEKVFDGVLKKDPFIVNYIGHKNLKIGFINNDYKITNENAEFFIFIEDVPFRIGLFNERKKELSDIAKKKNSPVFYVNKVSVENEGKNLYAYTGKSFCVTKDGEINFLLAPNENETAIYDTEKICNSPEFCVPSNMREIYETITISAKYFLRNAGLKRVVIGVSGGIDSAVTTAIYGKILLPDDILLVNLPSRYNSNTTKTLAEKLAKNIGANYAVFPIEESVKNTIKEIENTPVTFLNDGGKFNLTLSSFDRENVQARDRGSRILSALASAFSHSENGEYKPAGFTCNANKTESAVGYATLYGDNAGFLAAIADLWKYQVYELARFLNEEIYEREVIPKGIINIVPSAELSENQNVDEGKGDPLFYPYHDFLLRAFVEKFPKVTPEDILIWYNENALEKNIGSEEGIVKTRFKTDEDFVKDLERWYNALNGIAVAKRLQAPPNIALTARPFGSFKETQGKPFYGSKYFGLKEKLLNK